MAKKAAKRKAASSARKGSTKRQKATTKNRRAGKPAPGRANARKKAPAKLARKTATRGRKKTAPAKSRAKKPSGGARKTARATGGAKKPRGAKKKTAARSSRKKSAAPPRGSGGRERYLAQTPETGRSVKGPTNPFPTRRSTGTAAGAGSVRHAPDLERARRRLREVDETVPSPPSSLDPERRHASAARTGRQEMREARRDHPEVSPEITSGDVDADWAGAYDAGDEAPGGDNPTPDQDRVDDIGKALGVEYEDNEELKASDKIAERDKNRWELDPASSDDYRDRD
jgi:hypothetical protein